MSTLRDHIHQLVRPHAHRRPDGKITTRDALLDQLAAAVHTSKGGGRDSNAPSLPINTAAVELQAQITQDLQREELDRSGSPLGTARDILGRWEHEDRAEWVTHLEHATLDLIDQIKMLLDPPPKRRPLRKPCPACRKTWTLNGDDERTSALTAGTHDEEGAMRKPADYDVACTACGAEWRGKQLTWVLQVIADTPIREITPV